MAGYDLKEGRYDPRKVSDDELWAAFSCVFSSKSRNDSSYKYGFLKAIIDNLYNVDENLMLSFDQLFSKFGEIYWNLILKHGLRQKARTNDNRETYLEQVLHSTVKKYHIDEAVPYESLPADVMIDIAHQVKVKCKKYVVGALYEDTNRLFYSFSKKDEWLQINPLMYEFICKHKVAIEKLNYYEWAKFLEKVNDELLATKLLDKLDKSAKRSNLGIYRQILFDEFESRECFYCGKKLREKGIQVDHFIPWSFIKDDKLWNMVLACPSCNNGKRDKLATEPFLDKLLMRNKDIRLHYYNNTLELSRTIDIRAAEEMRNYGRVGLLKIYNYAQENGYDEQWQPMRHRNE